MFVDCKGATHDLDWFGVSRLPAARGRLSAHLFEALQGTGPIGSPPPPDSDVDAHLALWALYELHYRDFCGVSSAWEWDPDLLAIRRGLEERFEADLRARIVAPDPSGDPVQQLRTLIDQSAGPSVARFVQRHADRDQVREILKHRSLYHLKEADPTTWTIPRLPAAAKAGMVEIQYDEYGCGDPARVHQRLFVEALTAAGLSSARGAYVDEAPVEVLALNNAMSLFGLHRRLVGAAIGHFAAFESTSALPSKQMAQGLQRLGFPEATRRYYEEHVEADAVHEEQALRQVVRPFLEDDPTQRREVSFGALVCLALEDDYASAVLPTRNSND
ncbi:iron-containing redox enzyme family protein [Nocardioides limicola]|uniref:iron-containing redox enzyme family protein n=1 Tax=Nocardioides limicola TaxID=2803368 RepID=UPI00193BBD7F|nr:iron-containing redox enzyme family protein [Nocardioides sp. DJM-14]